MLFTLATAASLIASAAAHATWQEFWIEDVDAGSSCVRLPVSNSPVTDVTSDDIACNAGATASAGVCSVTAGDTVTVEMHQQPDDRSCANEAIGGNHYGPVIVYMAAATTRPLLLAPRQLGSKYRSQDWFRTILTTLVTKF